MDRTPNLGLPDLAAAQSQKHDTHNEALRALDALIQTAVVIRSLAAPLTSVHSQPSHILIRAKVVSTTPLVADFTGTPMREGDSRSTPIK